MVRNAAPISSGWEDRLSASQRALPAGAVRTVSGMCRSAAACITSASATPCATSTSGLKLIVAAGICPWWRTASGAVAWVTRVTLPSGTCAPLLAPTKMRLSALGSVCKRGSASSTTRYWLRWS